MRVDQCHWPINAHPIGRLTFAFADRDDFALVEQNVHPRRVATKIAIGSNESRVFREAVQFRAARLPLLHTTKRVLDPLVGQISFAISHLFVGRQVAHNLMRSNVTEHCRRSGELAGTTVFETCDVLCAQ